ncbi:MAG: hypothetical protein WBG48_13450 [Pricia sp.]
MAQDLRNLFENERNGNSPRMKPGHTERFRARLENRFPKQRKPWGVSFKIAASVLILLGIGIYFLVQHNIQTTPRPEVAEKEASVETEEGISLGDLSPDLKKVEDYYMANINYELSKLEVSDENKAMVASFMKQLGVLNQEYQTLNTELNRTGPNDQTITALIKNLQLRLQLLQKLKEKLKQLNTSKNETV